MVPILIVSLEPVYRAQSLNPLEQALGQLGKEINVREKLLSSTATRGGRTEERIRSKQIDPNGSTDFSNTLKLTEYNSYIITDMYTHMCGH